MILAEGFVATYQTSGMCENPALSIRWRRMNPAACLVTMYCMDTQLNVR